MIHRAHFDAAIAVLGQLEARKRELGLSDMAMFRKSGVARSTFGKWRHGERRAHFVSVIAAADALGLDIVLQERQS